MLTSSQSSWPNCCTTLTRKNLDTSRNTPELNAVWILHSWKAPKQCAARSWHAFRFLCWWKYYKCRWDLLLVKLSLQEHWQNSECVYRKTALLEDRGRRLPVSTASLTHPGTAESKLWVVEVIQSQLNAPMEWLKGTSILCCHNIKISAISMGGIAIKEAARLQRTHRNTLRFPDPPDEIHQTLPQIRTLTPGVYVLWEPVGSGMAKTEPEVS